MTIASRTAPVAVPLPPISRRLGIPLPVPTRTGQPIRILESRYEEVLTTAAAAEDLKSAEPLPISSIRGLVPLRLRWRRLKNFLLRRKESFGIYL
jgi:hypothetical protein